MQLYAVYISSIDISVVPHFSWKTPDIRFIILPKEHSL